MAANSATVTKQSRPPLNRPTLLNTEIEHNSHMIATHAGTSPNSSTINKSPSHVKPHLLSKATQASIHTLSDQPATQDGISAENGNMNSQSMSLAPISHSNCDICHYDTLSAPAETNMSETNNADISHDPDTCRQSFTSIPASLDNKNEYIYIYS